MFVFFSSDDEHEPEEGNREEKIVSKFLLASLSTLTLNKWDSRTEMLHIFRFDDIIRENFSLCVILYVRTYVQHCFLDLG